MQQELLVDIADGVKDLGNEFEVNSLVLHKAKHDQKNQKYL